MVVWIENAVGGPSEHLWCLWNYLWAQEEPENQTALATVYYNTQIRNSGLLKLLDFVKKSVTIPLKYWTKDIFLFDSFCPIVTFSDLGQISNQFFWNQLPISNKNSGHMTLPANIVIWHPFDPKRVIWPQLQIYSQNAIEQCIYRLI